MRLTPPRILLGLVILAVVGLAAYQRATPTAPRLPENVLRVVTFTPIATLHPHKGATILPTRLVQALWEGLFEIDPATQQPRPALAESWEISADAREVQFHLRADAKWSNGESVTAEDFVRGVHEALRTGAGGDSLLILQNARAYREQTFASPDIVGIAALGERTLRLRLERPVPGLFRELCAPTWFPLHQSAAEVLRDEAYRADPTALITNGAFALVEVTRDGISLRGNPHYHSPHEVALSGVDVIYTESSVLFPALFRAGLAHLSDRLATGELQRPIALPDVELHREPTLITGFVHFNTRHGPLRDARVRRALSLALDRGALADASSKGDVRPAVACLPPIAEWRKVRTVEENLAEARRLLAEAGYPNGAGFPVLKWPHRPGITDAFNRLAVECAVQWRERLGVPVYVFPVDADRWEELREHADYDLALTTWFGPVADLGRLANQLIEPPVRELSGWRDNGVTALVAEARGLRGAAQRERVLAAERAFLNAMPATPLVVFNRHTLRHRAVAGWHADPVGMQMLKTLRLEAPEVSP